MAGTVTMVQTVMYKAIASIRVFDQRTYADTSVCICAMVKQQPDDSSACPRDRVSKDSLRVNHNGHLAYLSRIFTS